MLSRSNLSLFCKRQSKLVDRGGFTMMELILVMALLIMVGALSAPSFVGWAENQRLRKSGDIVQTAWARARIRAMKSGETIVFRYEIGGSRYRVEAWQTPGEMAGFGFADQFGLNNNNSNDPLLLPSADGDDPSLANDDTGLSPSPLGLETGLESAEQVLPRGITFVGSEIELDERDLFMRDQLMQDSMPTSWSSPILFYPDGSASQTKLQLTDTSFNRFVLVTLRGMTGLAQVTDILSLEEVNP